MPLSVQGRQKSGAIRYCMFELPSGLKTFAVSAKRLDDQCFEMRDAVRLRPESNLAGVLERTVNVADEWLPIEGHREAVALGSKRQGMPFLAGDFDVRSREFLAS